MIKKQVQESREKQIEINKKEKKKIIVKIFSGYNQELNESDSDKKKNLFPNMPVRRQTRVF